MAAEQVLEIIRRQEEANAWGDAEGAVRPLANDAVVFDLPPPLLSRGADARDADGPRAWFKTWQDGVTMHLQDPTVIVEGDLAVVFGLSSMKGTKVDGAVVDSWNRRTVVLRRQGDAWFIIHDHSSYPMAMDGSGLAVTDLKPE